MLSHRHAQQTCSAALPRQCLLNRCDRRLALARTRQDMDTITHCAFPSAVTGVSVAFRFAFKGTMRAQPYVPAAQSIAGTVSVSILGSFVFGQRAFTAPRSALLTRAAAQERPAAVPSGAARHRRVEHAIVFEANLLSGAAWRSLERCADWKHSSRADPQTLGNHGCDPKPRAQDWWDPEELWNSLIAAIKQSDDPGVARIRDRRTGVQLTQLNGLDITVGIRHQRWRPSSSRS